MIFLFISCFALYPCWAEKIELPKLVDIVEFKSDSMPRNTYFRDFMVSKKYFENILLSYYQVPEYTWEHAYSHVANEDRTGKIILEDGTEIKWLVRPGGLARLIYPNGQIVFLVKELQKQEQKTSNNRIHTD